MDVRAGSDWPAATPARLWELQAQWVARESRSESVGVAEKSLASLCAPLDDALDSTPRQNALEPWKDLEQWRLYCVDFNRFRAKNRDKAKRLIRAGIPEPIRVRCSVLQRGDICFFRRRCLAAAGPVSRMRR